MATLTLRQAAPVPVADEGWDYRTANTKQVTHGIHPYPAMMIPQVAQRLMATYGSKGARLFDPYCGSGTTLLEGMLVGMEAVGTDLNPLARLLARVKTTPISIAALDAEIDRFPSEAPLAALPTPDVPNIDYWFSSKVQHDLAAIRHHIDGIACTQVSDIFRVAFSATVRKASWTRSSEFKLYRMPQAQMEKHNVSPFLLMIQEMENIRYALLALSAVANGATTPAVHDFNSVDGIPEDVLARGSVDLVVTSPPYGDSHTTVAYGQFSRLSSQWLGYAGASQVDRTLMGGRKVATIEKFGLEELDHVIAHVGAQDEGRAREVASFFEDYRSSIGHVSTSIREGGYACYVVGNRTVKGYEVPTAEATAAFFEANGFETVDIHRRNIPNKRMPSMNSPSNVPGQTGKTMSSEQIVVCRKV